MTFAWEARAGRRPDRTTALIKVILLAAGTGSPFVTTDTAAVPDPDLFLTCLGEGFDEVTDLAS